MTKKTLKKSRQSQQLASCQQTGISETLKWAKASYHFHTFAYRDPRSAFSSAPGLPVVSPTAVLLGIASTLFNLGKSDEAKSFLNNIHNCRVAVDPPDGIIFFRAFHQLRRYETDKYNKSNPRLGLTNINQGTREYGLVEGILTLFVSVPNDFLELAMLALRNRDHLGTHDSLCSLVGDVEICSEPVDVLYIPQEEWITRITEADKVTIVTLSRFKCNPIEPAVGNYWWMSGGEDTELAPYLIKGNFFGTSRGKIFRKY